MTHIALTATGRWFDRQRGRAISLALLGHQGGEGTLPLVFAGLAGTCGYRAGWVAGAVALLLIDLLLPSWAYRLPRSRKVDGEAKTPANARLSSWTRGEVFKRSHLLGALGWRARPRICRHNVFRLPRLPDRGQSVAAATVCEISYRHGDHHGGDGPRFGDRD